MSDHDLCMSLLAARSLALSLCRSLAIMLGPYHVSTPSRQPGLFCVLEQIEWVAGGRSLTFVLARREPHWSCATQTCPPPPPPSLVLINIHLSYGFSFRFPVRFPVVIPVRLPVVISVIASGSQIRVAQFAVSPGFLQNPGRKSGSLRVVYRQFLRFP